MWTKSTLFLVGLHFYQFLKIQPGAVNKSYNICVCVCVCVFRNVEKHMLYSKITLQIESSC
jgi:hypothetical protein